MSNVLLILADDMRQDLLPFMPHVSSVLRSEGTEFTNAYCGVPICQSARATLLTGQRANGPNNGVYQNSHIIPSYDNLLPTWFTGVARGMFGKVPVNYAQLAARPGWDTWQVLASAREQEAHGYTVYDGSAATTPAPHQTSYMAGQVESFITTAPEPFLCWWSPTNPHINTTTFTNNPFPGSMQRFAWLRWPFELLTSTDSKPSWIASRPQLTTTQLAGLRHAIRQQVREVTDLDERIAALTAALESAGRLADTYIVFVSDSGVFFGEQRLGAGGTGEKDQPYDVAAKVPCIIRGPGIPAGEVNDTPVSLDDVTAMIATVLGGSPPITQHGTDLRTFITAPDPSRAVLYQRRSNSLYPDCDGVITSTRKLMRYPTQSSPDRYEAYDLDTDPHEETSWANDPGRLGDRDALEAQLDALLA